MVGHLHPRQGETMLQELEAEMLQQRPQVSLGMPLEWAMLALPKVSEWWSEHELRLGSAIGLGDPEFEEECPDSAGAKCWSGRERSQCVPSAQLRMHGRLQLKKKWLKMYEPHPCS